MENITSTSAWLAGPGERRLREISNTAASRLPYSEAFASSIDSDIAAIYRLAIDFKRQSNAYKSPILRLSSEIIWEIFTCVAVLEPVKAKSLGWIRLGHVSHRFNMVLLSMRWLWASVICDVGPCAWGEVLERAGSAPPTLKLADGGEDPPLSRISYVATNLTRARHLTILEYNPSAVMWIDSPRDLAGVSFPDLEDLHVEAMHRPLRDPLWLGTEVYEINPICAPKLRVVSLTNICVPFPPENLTTLTLKRVQHYSGKPLPNGDDILPSPDTFLALLKRCVNVRWLCLEHMIPDIKALPSPVHPQTDAVHLPFLKGLTMNAELPRLLALWSYFSVAPDATIKFGVDFTRFPDTSGITIDQERLSVFPRLSHHFACSKLSEATALHIGMQPHTFRTTCCLLKRRSSFVSEAWETLPVHRNPGAYAEFVEVCFHKCIWGASVNFTCMIASIPALVFSSIDTLELVQVESGDSLARLLAHLPHLHTLRLSDLDRDSLAALSSFAAFPNSSHSISAPSLIHLHLSNAKLCADPARSSSQRPSVRDVLDILCSRYGAGIPFRSLGIDVLTSDLDASQLTSFTAQAQGLVLNVQFKCLKALGRIDAASQDMFILDLDL